ncbi:hypothetical protein RYA05_02060 [Pseudomonas syringae pv. actinidiae]|nr:hypothetical protein [Pseudomonas syringae pv. actinidiae]
MSDKISPITTSKILYSELENDWKAAKIAVAPADAPEQFSTGRVLMYRQRANRREANIIQESSYWDMLKMMSNHMGQVDVRWVSSLEEALKCSKITSVLQSLVPFETQFFLREKAFDEMRHVAPMAQIVTLGATSAQNLWVRPVSWNGSRMALLIEDTDILKIPGRTGGERCNMLTTSELLEPWELIAPALVLDEPL